MPSQRRKRQRLGASTTPADRLAAEHPDHVWALDYQFDQTTDGRLLKLLNVVDEHTYIEPGAPWQNPYVESFGGRLRDELLAVEACSSLLKAQVLVADWRIEYNTVRPHSALGDRTPSDGGRHGAAPGQIKPQPEGMMEMWIRRVMPNLFTNDLAASRRFYAEFLGLKVAMDQPGFLLLSSPTNPTAQLTVVSAAQADWDPNTRCTQMAVEVGDVDAVYADAQRRGLPIVYPITDEPWGIRRFFVQDPSGTVINVHSHAANLPHTERR